MDGLSGAASVFGVVSLTIQLAGTVKQAREFFHDARDASNEVRRLRVALANMQMMLETMCEALRLQEGRLSQRSSLSSVRTALESCKHTLAPLESFAQESASRLHDKSRRWQHATAKLRVAVKKTDVMEMEGKLRMAMMVLQTAMICNITELGVAQLQQTNGISQQVSHKTYHSAVSNTHARTTSYALSTLETIERERNRAWCSPPFSAAYEFLDHGRRISLQPNKTTIEVRERRSRLMLLSTWIRAGAELCTRSTLGTLHWTLNTYPVVDASSEYFAMSAAGDIPRLSQAFSEKKISPFCVDQNGRTFLHHSVGSPNSSAMLEFLLSLTLQPDRRDCYGRTALQHWSDRAPESLENASTDTVAGIRSLVRNADLDFTRVVAGRPATQKFSMPFFGRDLVNHLTFTYEMILDIFLMSLDLRQMEMDYFSPLGGIARQYGLSLDPEWSKLLLRTLRMGFDVHGSTPDLDGTPLDQVFCFSEDPTQSGLVGAAWLKILKDANIVIDTYMRIEEQLHPQRRAVHPDLRPRIYSLDYGATPGVSWFWQNEEAGFATGLLREFKDLNLACGSVWTPTDSRKDESGIFVYPKWQVYDYWNERNMRDWMPPAYDWTLRRQAEARILRRQQKRRLNAQKSVGSRKRLAVPGSWID